MRSWLCQSFSIPNRGIYFRDGRRLLSRLTLLYGCVYRVLAQVGLILREIWKTMHLPHFTKTIGQVITTSCCAENLTVKYEIPFRWRRRAPKRVGEYNVT